MTSVQNYSTEPNITAHFSHAVARAIAKRIAKLALTDAVAAANDYSQHSNAMSAEERALFADYVADAVIELAAQ